MASRLFFSAHNARLFGVACSIGVAVLADASQKKETCAEGEIGTSTAGKGRLSMKERYASIKAEQAEADNVAAAAAATPHNAAFVFIKPHAVYPKVQALVKDMLAANGIEVLSEGALTSEEIDEKKLIDQHYYAIASKATILKPDQLNVPGDKFAAQFGLPWADALAGGNVVNAMDACARLGITADELDAAWGAAKRAKKLVKFGGGFYCGLVELPGKEPLYVFNGFFMSMRSKYTAPGKSIYYYSVRWDKDAASWEDFRSKVLGPTDPTQAPSTSVRGAILAGWKDLGLAAEPDVGDNGVHASASPFEALAERSNWLGAEVETDPFGAALVAAGVSPKTIAAWSVDPQVDIGGGKKGSLFDALEDTNADDCIAKCVELNTAGNAAA